MAVAVAGVSEHNVASRTTLDTSITLAIGIATSAAMSSSRSLPLLGTGAVKARTAYGKLPTARSDGL